MTDERESGWALDPKYDANGLLTAVITDEADGPDGLVEAGDENPVHESVLSRENGQAKS